MAKDRSDATRAERKEKKRKEKHERATTEDNGVKKAKKDKEKDKNSKQALDTANADPAAQTGDKSNGDVDMQGAAQPAITSGTSIAKPEPKKVVASIVWAKEDLVPFANPLADEKTSRRLLRGVTQGAKQSALKRGVKEGVKFARKAQETGKSGASKNPLPFAVALIAADVSPADVISHLPVLCEDYNIPYIYINSRRDLGQAAMTKRPTSIIFATRERPENKRKIESKPEDSSLEPWEKTFENMVKMIRQAAESVMI